MNVRYLNNNPGGQRLINNRSTWMINIGTHKKPYSDREWHLLRESLRESIERILLDPEFPTKCLFLVSRSSRSGNVTRLDNPIFRDNLNAYGINCMVSEFVIERGAKQGRIDSHILLEVVHSNTYLQFDNRAFKTLLKEELEKENLAFVASGIETDDPNKSERILEWAGGDPYVTFSSVGKQHTSRAQEYLLKNVDRQAADALDVLMSRVRYESNTLGNRQPVNQSPVLLPVVYSEQPGFF